MAGDFVLRRAESLEHAFTRIADAQLTRAAAALTSAELAPDARVHDARRRFKESRALVRLYRDALGDAFAEQNHWYRDAGRALAQYRDATASLAALEAIDATSPMRDSLRERRDALYGDAATFEATLRELLARFAAQRLRIHELVLHDVEDAVEAGLAKTISDGRDAMRAAYDTGEDKAFHEWRMRVKDQTYHVRLFARVWPRFMNVLESALHELSTLLGEHHDLTVVRAMGVADAAPIIARQSELVGKARPVAEKVYAAKPRARAREIMTLWRAW